MAAALAIVTVLEGLGLKALVKWPNDILLSGRKVCGILTESLFEGEKLEYCLLGIGLNLRDVPDAINSTSLEKELGFQVEERYLFEKIVDIFLDELKELSFRKEIILSKYKAVCITLGKEISFQRGEKLYKGRALDINDDGRLVVDINGKLEFLCFEEVDNVR